MASEINALRDAIVDRLANLTDFADTEVLGNKPADLLNQCAQAISSIGIYTVVSIPKGMSANRQSQRPILDPLSVYILIREDTSTNKTNKDATFLAERAYAALQWWTPPIAGSYMLTLAAEGMQEMSMKVKDTTADLELEVHAWELLFHTKLALAPAA